MKKIPFIKYAAAGNDFLVVENLKTDVKKLTIAACDRKTGVGADGILVLDKSKTCDYRMRIINSDSSEAEMCGNGVRCLATYIVQNKSPKKKRFTIETLAGTIQNEVEGNIASSCLSDPKDFRDNIAIDINSRKLHVTYIDTGVPHTIVFVSEIEKINVEKLGLLIRTHKEFAPRGTNANFVEQIKDDFIKVRTFERGVEGETLACGTGSVASAIVTFLKANPDIKTKKNIAMKVQTSGGEILEVKFDVLEKKVTNVWLTGKVKLIAKGEFYHV